MHSLSMAHALQNVSHPSTSPPEDATPSSSSHTIFNSVGIAGAATLLVGPHASSRPISSSGAAEVLLPASRVGGDSNEDDRSVRTRDSNRFPFRGTYLHESLNFNRQVLPLTVSTRAAGTAQLAPPQFQTNDPKRSTARQIILQALQNQAQRLSKGNQCRNSSSCFFSRKQNSEHTPLSSKSIGAGGEGMASSRIGILDESCENEENIPPHWSFEQGDVGLCSRAPVLKDHGIKPSGPKRATRRGHRDQDPRFDSHKLSGYVESLEAEVASLQTRLSALLATSTNLSVNLPGHAGMNTTEVFDHSSQKENHTSYQRDLQPSQDHDPARHEFEAALQQKVRHLEEKMRDRDARCSLLEEQVRQSELRAQQAEAGERALSRRVDMFGAMVASSPAKVSSLDTAVWAIAPITPSMNEPSIDRQSSFKTRIAMNTMARAPSTTNPVRPVSEHHKHSTVQIDDHGSWHQGIGTAEPIQENLPGDTGPALDVGDNSETASDLQSSNNDSTPPTSFGFADSRDQSSSSRPISLLSNASFSASWGLPASLGRACTEFPATCSIVSKRPAQQAKRMRRFPSTSGGLRPLILPNAAPCSEISPTRSTFSLSPSRPLSMTEPFSLVSPSAFNPESLVATAFASVSDREREQLRALRQLEGLAEDGDGIVGAESNSAHSKFSGTLAKQQQQLEATALRDLEQRCSTSLPSDQKEVFSKEINPNLLPSRLPPNSTSLRSISPTLLKTPKATPQLSVSTSASFPETLTEYGLERLMVNTSQHEPRRLEGYSNEPALSERLTTPADSESGERGPSTARTGFLARFKALANLVISPITMNETLLPLSNTNVRATQKFETSARNVLAKSFGKATKIFKQISPFHFGGLGWWLFGLSHWHRRSSKSSEVYRDQETNQSSSYYAYEGVLSNSTRTIDDQYINHAETQRRLALDGPGECLVMRTEPVYSFGDEHTALLGFGLPSSTPIVTVTQASDSPTLMRNLQAYASRSVASGSKAKGAADRAIDYLLNQGRRQCPSCVEPVIRHRIRLWAKFGLALILAVGVAILDGPESILGVSTNENDAHDLSH